VLVTNPGADPVIGPMSSECASMAIDSTEPSCVTVAGADGKWRFLIDDASGGSRG
jgi:hypothetical protein